MEQAATPIGQVVQKMIENPTNAWMALLPILFILLLVFVMWQNAKREERYHNTMDTTIAKQTETLSNMNVSLIQMKDSICDVKNRVEDIEVLIGVKEGGN